MSMKYAAAGLASLLVLTACSQETQDNAEEMAERAAADTEANAQVVGEVLEEGAADAAGAVSAGAADLQDNIEAGDENEPGPAPITGDNLGS